MGRLRRVVRVGTRMKVLNAGPVEVESQWCLQMEMPSTTKNVDLGLWGGARLGR
jgi:hypothetical protein